MVDTAAVKEGGANRLMRLMGLGTRRDDSQGLNSPSPLLVKRAEMLDSICQFLLEHDLEVSQANLMRAHSIQSGIDFRLARKVTAEFDAGEKIEQHWMDENAPVESNEQDKDTELEHLARALDRSMSQFGESTRNIKQAATNYGEELQRQVDLVDTTSANGASGEVVANLAQIATVMLDRTRQMEDEMRKGEKETSKLRVSLEKARQDASIDYLTKLPNRRAFEQAFIKERHGAENELEPLCLALCDIDLFKNVNDVHGHETGDRIIQAVARALDGISDQCHVARHGGEEFVLLFRGLNLPDTVRALDLARERFAARHFIDKISGKPIGGVTFSGGVVSAFEHTDLSETLRAADEALYVAKEAGRNRIEQG